MKTKPFSVEKNMLAAKALSIMNSKKITSLCVNKDKNKKKTIGIIHIHNILEANVYQMEKKTLLQLSLFIILLLSSYLFYQEYFKNIDKIEITEKEQNEKININEKN